MNGWQNTRLKSVITDVIAGDWGGDPNKSNSKDNAIVLRVADMDGLGFSLGNLTLRAISQSSYESRKITPQSLIIEKSGGGANQPVGRVSKPPRLDAKVICSNFMAKLDLSPSVDVDFMNYAFYSLYHQRRILPYIVQTTSIQNLKLADYLNLKIPLPPLEEQKQIAAYLDAHCNASLALKDKKQQMLKTLGELYSATIDAALCDGGGGKSLAFKRILSLQSGVSSTKADLKPSGIPCITYGEIHSKYSFEVDPLKDPLRCFPESYLKTHANKLLKRGDFAFADTSEDLEGSGNCTYLNSDTEIFAGYHTIIARPKIEISSRYLAYYFASSAFRNQIRDRVNGVKVYSITQSILKESIISVPPLKTQSQIVATLDAKLADIKALQEVLKKEIACLDELRNATIQQAVSGQINIKIDSTTQRILHEHT